MAGGDQGLAEGPVEGSKSQLEGSEGQLEGSEGQPEGSEGQPEGSEGQPAGSEGQPEKGHMNMRTYKWHFSPFLRTFSPVWAAAQKPD